jgi:phenylacetate-CoA ligase
LGLPRIDIVGGRETDFVVTPDGRFISGASLTLVSAPGIAQLQYIQSSEDTVMIRYVRTTGFSESSLVELKRRVADILGGELRFQLEEVKEIPLLPSGKLQYVYSDVARRRLAVSEVSSSSQGSPAKLV